MDVTFLFGAGAESGLGLPSGPEYTRQTMLEYHSKMLEVLKTFYGEQPWDNVGKYMQRKLYAKNSSAFETVVIRALLTLEIKEEQPEIKTLSDRWTEWCTLKNGPEKGSQSCKDAEKEYKDYLQDTVFPELFLDADQKLPSDVYKSLREKMNFGGVVERDMSTLIAPQPGDQQGFWRIVNYLWGAYFCIMLPLLSAGGKYRQQAKTPKKYEYILEHLSEIIEYVSGLSVAGMEKPDPYYTALSQAFPGSRALTTNYTPFVQNIWGASSAYLAGRLTQLMDPETLRVVDFSVEPPEPPDGLWIPFLMTQAPVKPLMNTCQVEEYAKALDFLREETDLLVVLGYSLGDSDNHINQMLQRYLSFSPEKRLLFCSYAEDRQARWVYERLRFLRGEAGGQIEVRRIQNADDVIAAIKQLQFGKELVTV